MSLTNKYMVIKLYNNILKIFGTISFENVVSVVDSCSRKTKHLKYVIIDFKNLNESNSSVLLFIINYIKCSIKYSRTVKFINSPKLLKELSKVYNLDKTIKRENKLCLKKR